MFDDLDSYNIRLCHSAHSAQCEELMKDYEVYQNSKEPQRPSQK